MFDRQSMDRSKLRDKQICVRFFRLFERKVDDKLNRVCNLRIFFLILIIPVYLKGGTFTLLFTIIIIFEKDTIPRE